MMSQHQEGGDSVAQRRLGHVPEWLSISEIRLVLEAFYGAFDGDSAATVQVCQPWDQRRFPPRVTVTELCAWLAEEVERVRVSASAAEANRRGLYGSEAQQRRGVA